MSVELRVALTTNAEFIYRVIETTMRGYVEKTWGSFKEETTRKNVAELIAAQEYAILQFEGQDIGALSVQRSPTHIQLNQLFILPPYQNRGFGTRIVRELAREAREAGKPLRLRVLAVNPARMLYEREGFKVVSTTPERIYMELAV
jgi:GNAT superfamily N-acetyltransferase